MATLICPPSPSTSLYSHTYARRGVHKIFVWTRQVVLISDSTFHFSLGKIPQLTYWKCFPPPWVKQSLSALLQNGVLHGRTSSCVCLYNKHRTNPTSLSTRTLQTRNRKHHILPLVVMLESLRHEESKMLEQPTSLDLDAWELEWIHLASSSSGLLYNPTGSIDIYRMYRYRTAALPAEVCTRTHKWSTAANHSPEESYSSTSIQTSQHLPRMKHAFVLG